MSLILDVLGAAGNLGLKSLSRRSLPKTQGQLVRVELFIHKFPKSVSSFLCRYELSK